MEASKTSAAVSFPAAFYQLPNPFKPPPPKKKKQTGTQADTCIEKDRLNRAGFYLMGPSQAVRATARCSYSLPPSLAWAEPLQTPAACLPLCSFLSCGCCCCFDAYSRCRHHHWFASFEQLLFVARYLLVLLCISSSVYAYSRLLCVCARLPSHNESVVIQALIISTAILIFQIATQMY